jgi:hypothetical protein
MHSLSYLNKDILLVISLLCFFKKYDGVHSRQKLLVTQRRQFLGQGRHSWEPFDLVKTKKPSLHLTQPTKDAQI